MSDDHQGYSANEQLAEKSIARRVSRRELLKRGAVLGLSAPVITGLLAACGEDGDADDVPAAEPDDEDSPEDLQPDDGELDADDDTASDDEAEPDDGRYGGSIYIAIDRNVTTLDPHNSSQRVDRAVYSAVFDKLVDINEELEVIPELATDWEISEDQLEVTFNLVENATFHDGTPFNAEAFVINYEKMLDADTGSLRTGEIEQIERVEAVDDYTGTMILSEPMSPLLSTLSDRAGMMLSPTAIEELGDDLDRRPIGTGPFRFVEWVSDSHVSFERNDDWWKSDLPYLDEVSFRVIPDDGVRLTSLLTDEVQVYPEILGGDAEDVEADDALVLSETPGVGFLYISLNNARPPFDNMALRQALAWTIDRDAINNAVYLGTATPAQIPVPPSSWAYDESIQIYHQDYDMARQKLEEGGHPDGFEFTMLAANQPVSIQYSEMYQAMMEEVGIIANIEVMEGATRSDVFTAGDYQAVPSGWSGRPDPDGNLYNIFHTNGAINRGSYHNPEVDELLEQQRFSSDNEERRQLISDACRIIAEEVPMVFVVYPAQLLGMSERVRNYVHIADGLPRVGEVWIED